MSGLLEKLLAQLILKVGPVLIEMIIRWLQGASNEEVTKVVNNVANAMNKGTSVA